MSPSSAVFTWMLPGPWHASHCTPCNPAGTTSVVLQGPPGWSKPTEWQPTHARSLSRPSTGSVSQACAWASLLVIGRPAASLPGNFTSCVCQKLYAGSWHFLHLMAPTYVAAPSAAAVHFTFASHDATNDGNDFVYASSARLTSGSSGNPRGSGN